MDKTAELQIEFSHKNENDRSWLSARFALYFWPALKSEDEFSDKELFALFLMMNASLLSFIHPHLHKKAKTFIEESQFPLMDGVRYRDAAAAGAMFALWEQMIFWLVADCADDEYSTPRLMDSSEHWKAVFARELELVQTTSPESLISKARTEGQLPDWKPELGGAEKFLLVAQKQLVDYFYTRKMGYCAQQVDGWFEGKFDVMAMTKCMQLPKAVIEAGPRDAQCHLLFDCLPLPSVSFTAEQRSQFLLTTGDELPMPEQHVSANQRIAQLEQALNQAQQASTTDSHETRRLKEELKKAQESLEQSKSALSTRIETAIDALKTSQSSVDKQISRNRLASLFLQGLSAAALVAGAWWWWCKHSLAALCAPTCKDDSVLLIYLQQFFPLVLAVIVSTILLRHDAKLLSGLNDLVRQKKTIEQLTGLFKASQYARRDIDESMKLAETTFDEISAALIASALREEPRKDSSEGASSTEISDLITLLRKIAPSNAQAH